MAPAKGPYDPVIVGADIGNATTVVASCDGSTVFFPSFLSSIGVGEYDGLSKISTGRHHIGYSGANVIVGADALDGIGVDTLLAEYDQEDAGRRYTEDRSLYCFLAGISAAFVNADAMGIRLATGAPLSIYQAWADAIKARYLGEHRYSYNGHDRRVVIRDVAVFGEGREVLRLLPAEERRGRIAVHDVGGRTWNVLLFRDGALVGSKTFDMGIDRLLNAVPSIPNDPGARWHLQQSMRRGVKQVAAYRASLEAMIPQALDTIERKVRIDRADRHVLVGGGAVYALESVKRRYKVPAQVLNGDAPEAANALAYALAMHEVAA